MLISTWLFSCVPGRRCLGAVLGYSMYLVDCTRLLGLVVPVSWGAAVARLSGIGWQYAPVGTSLSAYFVFLSVQFLSTKCLITECFRCQPFRSCVSCACCLLFLSSFYLSLSLLFVCSSTVCLFVRLSVRLYVQFYYGKSEPLMQRVLQTFALSAKTSQ